MMTASATDRFLSTIDWLRPPSAPGADFLWKRLLSLLVWGVTAVAVAVAANAVGAAAAGEGDCRDKQASKHKGWQQQQQQMKTRSHQRVQQSQMGTIHDCSLHHSLLSASQLPHPLPPQLPRQIPCAILLTNVPGQAPAPHPPRPCSCPKSACRPLQSHHHPERC